MRYKGIASIFIFITLSSFLISSKTVDPSVQLALLKYGGGGDWYANPTSLTNLASFCNQELGTNLEIEYATVEAGSPSVYNHPFLHMTGHGNVIFTDAEAENIRNYLLSGGFLHIDDNYGLDPFARLAMKKVFPELEFVELPFDHPIYHQKYNFDTGLPKIHKHDDKPAQGFGLIWEGRVICFYSYECDLGDGWEDQEVHNDPLEIRIKALQMGANIIEYAFTSI
jgi:hypothetical protein